ncbi:Na+/H+ antiporter subunit E [Zafaria sp. Z1313]|uniref:Na+/H+ antiporter subunit E n=1 Tax=Zafaria sp. Z1313 TaxID=3423202 RepID=UPI003D301965
MSRTRPSGLGTPSRGSAADRRRKRARFLVELPLLVWMMLVWGALWQDFSAGNLVFGFLLSLGVVSVFRLPPVELSGRFNVWQAFLFALHFLKDVVAASFQVFGLALFRGQKVRSAVVGITLRCREDLMMTTLGHVLTLIPGSFVVEVDRTSGTLYLHVIDVDTPEEAERFRAGVLDTEARLIKVMGTPEALEALRREEAPA